MLFDFAQQQQPSLPAGSLDLTTSTMGAAELLSAKDAASSMTVSDSEESEQTTPTISTKRAASKRSKPAQRSGRWTPDEKILFLYGLKRYGKGRWKKMSTFLPHR